MMISKFIQFVPGGDLRITISLPITGLFLHLDISHEELERAWKIYEQQRRICHSDDNQKGRPWS